MGVFIAASVGAFRGRHDRAAFPRWLLLPVLVSIIQALCRFITGFAVIARVDDAPRIGAAEIIGMLAVDSWEPLSTALLATLPSVLILAVGQYLRAHRAAQQAMAEGGKGDASTAPGSRDD